MCFKTKMKYFNIKIANKTDKISHFYNKILYFALCETAKHIIIMVLIFHTKSHFLCKISENVALLL